MRISYPLVRTSLAILTLVIGVSAVFGGLALVFLDGLGMPVSWLSGSPFNDYFWPGLILAFIVGGTHLSSSIMLFKNKSFAPQAAGVAGFGMLIWIFTEMYIIKHSDPLQAIYFVFGVVTLLAADELRDLYSKR